jgi:tellurite resistance protein
MDSADVIDLPRRGQTKDAPPDGASPARAKWRQLEYLPVSLFGSVMGLTGLSVAWRAASKTFGIATAPADSIGIAAIAVFAVLALAYGFKAASAPSAVLAEFRHPTAGPLFGTLPISLMLLPIVLMPYAQMLAQGVWIVGAVTMLVFAWSVVDRWMGNRQQADQATPSWLLPIVGLLNLPLAVPAIGLPPMHELMLTSLAIGLFFAIPLFTIVFLRLLFQPPLPPSLQPTQMILLAPFVVGYLSYVSVMGVVDAFAGALYGLSLFVLVVVMGRLRHGLLRGPFHLSWWSVSFPLASAAVVAVRFAGFRPGMLTSGIAMVLLAAASVTIAVLAVRTLFGIVTGELRRITG